MNSKKAKAARKLAHKWSRAPLGYVDRDQRPAHGVATGRVLHPLSSRAIYQQIKKAYNDRSNNNNNNPRTSDTSNS